MFQRRKKMVTWLKVTDSNGVIRYVNAYSIIQFWYTNNATIIQLDALDELNRIRIQGNVVKEIALVLSRSSNNTIYEIKGE